MAQNDTKLEVIGKALGHKHAASTRIYARFTLNPVRAAKKRVFGALHELRNGEATRELAEPRDAGNTTGSMS